MHVKIRKTSNGGKYAFEWQPENNKNGKWYGPNELTAENFEGGLALVVMPPKGGEKTMQKTELVNEPKNASSCSALRSKRPSYI